jgi:ketosteroid isomerase-like protein
MERNMTTREQMDRLIDQHVSAEDAGDIEAAVAVYTDDIEHDAVGAPDGPLHGVVAVRRRYEQLLQNMQSIVAGKCRSGCCTSSSSGTGRSAGRTSGWIPPR